MSKEFNNAIDEIIIGANRFKQVCEGEENTAYQEPDSESSFLRIPQGAFCLKLAYKVWSDLQNERRYGQLPLGGGLIGAGAGYVGKQTMMKQKMVEPKKSKEEMLYEIMSDMSPDEVDEFARLFRDYMTKRQRAESQTVIPPECSA